MKTVWMNTCKNVFLRGVKIGRYPGGRRDGFSTRHALNVVLAVMIAVIASGYSAMIVRGRLEELKTAATGLFEFQWSYLPVYMGLLFLAIHLAVLIWRFVLVCMYRPLPGCRNHELPLCTVVVPAYNEGRHVLTTLRSLAQSDYPPEKMQIIAVDDGSADDTWQWMLKAKDELGRRVSLLRLSRNQGKRKALCCGIKKSQGTVLVTVDSDSTVDPQTLRNLVSPFVHNHLVGGIAGNVRVLNPEKGLIPRMMDVIFVYSFDFIRASQSQVNTVMCTPGALSAYRRDIVMRVLEEWLSQTFCGYDATIGEDRAMTNLILKQGYHVRFQRNAMVYTQVPQQYDKLCRMLLRWARSNIRETIAMSRFVFRRFRKGSMLGARINLLMGWMGMTKTQMCLIWVWYLFLSHPLTYAPEIFSGIFVFSGICAGFYVWRYHSAAACWAFAYGVFWFFGLFWINPYALLTPHHSGWLTRDIKSPQRKRLFSFR